jgi:hypothetical protein
MEAIHGCESGKMTRKARIDSVTQGRSGGARNARAPERAAVAHWLDQHAAATGDRRYRHAASILRSPPAGRPPCADDPLVIERQWLFDTGRAGAIETTARMVASAAADPQSVEAATRRLARAQTQHSCHQVQSSVAVKPARNEPVGGLLAGVA